MDISFRSDMFPQGWFLQKKNFICHLFICRFKRVSSISERIMRNRIMIEAHILWPNPWSIGLLHWSPPPSNECVYTCSSRLAVSFHFSPQSILIWPVFSLFRRYKPSRIWNAFQSRYSTFWRCPLDLREPCEQMSTQPMLFLTGGTWESLYSTRASSWAYWAVSKTRLFGGIPSLFAIFLKKL